MIFYPIFIRPARGFTYRRRSDGVTAAVRLYKVRSNRVLLVDRDDRCYRETIHTFWTNWIHRDLYDTERN